MNDNRLVGRAGLNEISITNIINSINPRQLVGVGKFGNYTIRSIIDLTMTEVRNVARQIQQLEIDLGKNDDINFTLFKPAIVTMTKATMPKRWKLEQKGYLEPTLSIQ